MKKHFLITQLLLSIMLIIPFACTPVPQEFVEDNYFAPVDSVKRQSVKPAPIQKLVEENTASESDNSTKITLAESLLEQDRHLDDLTCQLNMQTNKGLIDTTGRQNVKDIISTKKISNEMLLEMIRKQNQRLEAVIEQLKSYAENQKKNKQELLAQQQILSSEINLDYGAAILLYRQQQYTKAIPAFQALLKKGIDNNLKDNCYFWTGVCYFNLKKTNRALNEFFKVLEISDSDKRDGAYFMIGQCYERMGIKGNARTMFKKVVLECPEGDLKRMAEIKLALLR